MKKKYILLATFISILLGSCTIDEAKREYNQPKMTHIEKVGDVYNGNIVVKMKKEVPLSASHFESISGLEIYSVNKLFPTDPRFEERHREAGLHLWYHITFNPNTPVTKAYQDFNSIEGVDIIEFLPKVQRTQSVDINNPFNDPLFSQQWHYNNNQQGSGYVQGVDINLLKAWGIETGDSSVVVAIIDSGVDYKHEDLADAMWVNKAELNGERGVDDDGNGYIDDIYGYNFTVGADGSSMKGGIVPDDHGTHVAGIVGGITNNGKFGAGIAGGNGTEPGVKLMTCQTIDGNSPAYIATAFVYAADNGAVIAQNSWSIKNEDTYLIDAINYFKRNAGTDKYGKQISPMKGGVVIFAAGNDNVSVGHPASYDGVIAVSAIGPSGAKASYSNYGDWVDIAAPGGEVNSSYVVGDIYSTTTNNGFKGMSGTSMACPHVSGVAALIASRFGGPGFTNDMLTAKLLNSADSSKLYSVNENFAGLLGKGTLDAFAALYEDSDAVPEVVKNVKVEPFSNQLNISWNATETKGRPTYGYRVYYSEEDLSEFTPNDKNSNVNVAIVSGGGIPIGQTINCKLKGLKFNTKYYIRVASLSESNVESELSSLESVSTGNNISPVLTPDEDITVTLKSFESVQYNIIVKDLDEHNWDYEFTGAKEAISGKLAKDTILIKIDAKYVGAGSYESALVVTDEHGGESSIKINYTVLANNPPKVTAQLPNLLIPRGETKTIDLTQYINDEDGEILQYTFGSSSTAKIVEMSIDGTTLNVKGNWYGSTTISVTGTDIKGSSATNTFDVLIRDSSIPVDIFPNPMKDYLTIRTGSDERAKITVSSSLGAIVYQSEDITVGPFNPLSLDVTTWDSGIYTIEIVTPSVNFKRNVVKL